MLERLRAKPASCAIPGPPFCCCTAESFPGVGIPVLSRLAYMSCTWRTTCAVSLARVCRDPQGLRLHSTAFTTKLCNHVFAANMPLRSIGHCPCNYAAAEAATVAFTYFSTWGRAPHTQAHWLSLLLNWTIILKRLGSRFK